jgi:predicted nucleic acid-binding protein
LSVYYLDTSSLAKRYIAEDGSTWMLSLLRPKFGHTIIISELSLVELISVFAKKKRDNHIKLSQLRYLRGRFSKHVTNKEYFLLPIHEKVLSIAQKLLVKYDSPYLRSLDAIHLASAIHARSIINQVITFIASDEKLKQVALLEGFRVDDPQLHP